MKIPAPGDRRASRAWATPHLLLAATIFLLPPAHCTGAFVSLTPVADTTLIEFLPDNNLGGGTELLGGTGENLTRHRPMMKFDVTTAIPPGSRITGAQLVLTVTKVPQNGYAFSDYGLNRMFKNWGEGNKLSPTNCNSCAGWGAPASTNEACWLDAFTFAPGGWSAPGAQPTNDFAPFASSATTVYKENDNPYVLPSSATMIADIQLWLDKPSTNFGWMLLCQAEGTAFSARRFGSREHPTFPPQLQISYVVPPRFTRIEKFPGQFNLYCTQPPDENYRIEYRSSLSTGNWQTLGTFPANGNTNNILVVDTTALPQRFYRLVSE